MSTYPSIPVPDYPIKQDVMYDIISTDMPGKERTRARHTTSKRSWILKYSKIHGGDCTYLWNFFIARKGQHESFTFVHPETAVSYTARFAMDSLKREEIAENLFNVTIDLLEVI